MLHVSVVARQLPRQLLANSIGYSSAFVDRNERPLDDHQQATALYSPAATYLRRRRGHVPRQQKYTDKVKLINSMARQRVGEDD